MLVVPLISPARAFLYNPLGSRASTTLSGASTKTSIKSMLLCAWSVRAVSRSTRYGEMKAVIQMHAASAKSFATFINMVLGLVVYLRKIQVGHTSPMRRIFSFRDFSSNPRSLLRPKRMLSPSSLYANFLRWRRCCSRAQAMVDCEKRHS